MQFFDVLIIYEQLCKTSQRSILYNQQVDIAARGLHFCAYNNKRADNERSRC